MKKSIVFLSTLIIVVAMFFSPPFTYKAHALTEEEVVALNNARVQLQEILAEREVMAVVYLDDTYVVRQSAFATSESVVEVPSGQTVFIQDVAVDDANETWYYVNLYYQGTEYYGYIQRQNLACSDERLLGWEDEYGMGTTELVTYTDEDGSLVCRDIAQFPASYQAALTELKQKHPNWTFVPLRTGLDWNTVIANEIIGGRSLVHSSLPDYCKEGAYDNVGWYYASREVLERYMDPRNSLNEDAIFQFEQLTYNESYHTQEAIKNFLENTFMNSSQNAPGTDMKFYYIFWAIGAEEGRKVSPFHLAARVLQEQGQGKSALISGTYPGYEGYYNYFNVGATGTTNKEIIENGLKLAKAREWKGAYYSILGGADVISASYIKKGQDTLYLQKYNVAPYSQYAHYTHQYMQNISAPTTEAKSVKKLYAEANALESTFVFKIPVYENMPATACAMPTASTNVVLQVPAGYDNSTIYVDGIPYSTEIRNQRAIATLPNGEGKTAVVFRYDTNGTPTGMYVWTLDYKNKTYVATAQPTFENLLTYHGFSMRIADSSGIRFKTGISADLRSALTTTGVNGYKLKEYGTLVMNQANRAFYPMIKGGEKVLSSMSYGTDGYGNLQDAVYETAGGGYLFASALVDLPAERYKTEFAFGSYLVLEKAGAEITIYGPVQAKSLYSQAGELLNLGSYVVGSKEDVFLRKLIADGDSVEQSRDTDSMDYTIIVEPDGAIPDSVPEVSPEVRAKVEAFVERMYTVALGRASDPDGLQFWTNKLLSYKNDGAGIAHGFILSSEFKNKNYSNEEYIKVLYKTFFNREAEADADGFTYWKGILNTGHSRETVLAGFVNSAEFKSLCTEYGISSGILREDGTVVNPGAVLFTERLYTKALGRSGEIVGVEYWATCIEKGRYTPEAVAKEFFWSEEYLNKKTDDEKYVETLYQTFMDRASDPSGKANWLNHLKNGAGRESVLEGFARSSEFKAIMDRYGL